MGVAHHVIAGQGVGGRALFHAAVLLDVTAGQIALDIGGQPDFGAEPLGGDPGLHALAPAAVPVKGNEQGGSGAVGNVHPLLQLQVGVVLPGEHHRQVFKAMTFQSVPDGQGHFQIVILFQPVAQDGAGVAAAVARVQADENLVGDDKAAVRAQADPQQHRHQAGKRQDGQQQPPFSFTHGAPRFPAPDNPAP